jgi:hypothetical protein
MAPGQARRLDLVEPAVAVVDGAQDAQRLIQRRRPVAAGDGQFQRVETGGGVRQWACARR